MPVSSRTLWQTRSLQQTPEIQSYERVNNVHKGLLFPLCGTISVVRQHLQVGDLLFLSNGVLVNPGPFNALPFKQHAITTYDYNCSKRVLGISTKFWQILGNPQLPIVYFGSCDLCAINIMHEARSPAFRFGPGLSPPPPIEAKHAKNKRGLEASVRGSSNHHALH